MHADGLELCLVLLVGFNVKEVMSAGLSSWLSSGIRNEFLKKFIFSSVSSFIVIDSFGLVVLL